MMLFTFIFIYVLGGLTFVPVLVAAFIAFVFYTSPQADPETTPKPPLPADGNADPTVTSEAKEAKDEEGEEDVVPKIYRTGWLTVRRTFEPMPSTNSEGTYVGMMVSGYRSFMDQRSKDPKRTRPKDQFFVALKGKVLFLYENEEMTECFAAIEVGLHKVVMYPEDCLDGEIFMKRNAICLKPVNGTGAGTGMGGEGEEVKKSDLSGEGEDVVEHAGPGHQLPWFIFTKTNIEKEDWYHTLISSMKLSGDPRSVHSTFSKDKSLFDSDDMARLVEGIDSQPDPIPMRWLNALVGRVFFSIYRTAFLEDYIVSRIVRKLSRVKKPSFLSEIVVKEVNVGSSVPYFSKPMLKELTTEGEASMEVGVNYSGNFRITVATTATINLGSRFKPYSVRLILAVVLKELEGSLLLRVKKPPSNRLWFGFTTMPRMVLTVEPVVSTRQIKWSLILKPIEARIKEIIAESVVLPNMDDLSFFNSWPYENRAGIWGDAARKPRETLIPQGEPASANGGPAAGEEDDEHHVPAGKEDKDGRLGGQSSSVDEGLNNLRQRNGRDRRDSDTNMDGGLYENSNPSTASLSSSIASGSTRPTTPNSSSSDANRRRSWFGSGRKVMSTTTINPPNPSSSTSLLGTSPPQPSKIASPRPTRIDELSFEDQSSARDSSPSGASTSSAPDVLEGVTNENETAASKALKSVLEAAQASPPSAEKTTRSASSSHLKGLSGVGTDEERSEDVGLGMGVQRAKTEGASLTKPAGSALDEFGSTSSASSTKSSVVSQPRPSTQEDEQRGRSSDVRSAPPRHAGTLASSASSSSSNTPVPTPRSQQRQVSPTPPQRRGHQSTISDVNSGSGQPPTTASLIRSWTVRASDKESIAAAASQAKDAMKKYWSNRKAAKGGTLGGGDGGSSVGYSSAGSSMRDDPRQSASIGIGRGGGDGGGASSDEGSSPPEPDPVFEVLRTKSRPTSAGNSRRSSPERESYKEHRANRLKAKGSREFDSSRSPPSSVVDIPSLVPPAPAHYAERERDANLGTTGTTTNQQDSVRRASVSTAHPGRFTPAPSVPTTSLSPGPTSPGPGVSSPIPIHSLGDLNNLPSFFGGGSPGKSSPSSSLSTSALPTSTPKPSPPSASKITSPTAASTVSSSARTIPSGGPVYSEKTSYRAPVMAIPGIRKDTNMAGFGSDSVRSQDGASRSSSSSSTTSALPPPPKRSVPPKLDSFAPPPSHSTRQPNESNAARPAVPKTGVPPIDTSRTESTGLNQAERLSKGSPLITSPQSAGSIHIIPPTPTESAKPPAFRDETQVAETVPSPVSAPVVDEAPAPPPKDDAKGSDLNKSAVKTDDGITSAHAQPDVVSSDPVATAIPPSSAASAGLSSRAPLHDIDPWKDSTSVSEAVPAPEGPQQERNETS